MYNQFRSLSARSLVETDFAVQTIYRIVASSSPSRIEAHAGLFRLLNEGDFRSLCTVTF